MKNCLHVLSLSTFLATGSALADTASGTGGFNYTWMDAVINKTPVKAAACPEIDTDIYGSGFQVALQKAFYLSLSAAGARWFPHVGAWASVGIGPIKNNFGIFFSDINKLSELSEEKEKHVPDSYEEINRWKMGDRAYWESQGGVGLYIGAGISPVDVGVFAVATGGWVHFVQKTGPTKVYVELAKKNVKSLNLSGGIIAHAGIEKEFDKSKGFAYEFNLDNQDSIEAYERFMAGDVTKAQELSKFTNSGVNKISDTTDFETSFARSVGLATPFFPIFSFKASTATSYDHSEEASVWNEESIKDTGMYEKQRNLRIGNAQIKESRSFAGGKKTFDAPGATGSVHTETLFGNFKYNYQSNWGQERRLRKYIARAKALTGLVAETCATVPAFDDSLGFNQVLLQVNWSDAYVKKIVGLDGNKSNANFLASVKNMALNYQEDKDNNSTLCNVIDNDGVDDTCTNSTPDEINGIFKNLQGFAAQMNKSYGKDNKEFAKNMVKFGQEIWKSPYVFKAFYEKGKVCGQDFTFEVSGQRLTRHSYNLKFAPTDACSRM